VFAGGTGSSENEHAASKYNYKSNVPRHGHGMVTA
jgi:hypothetical protein